MSTSLSDSSIITLFQNASPSSRHDFLQALSQQFHPSEWHHLHQLLDKQSYYFDLMPLLPLEISLQILSYLPLREVVLLRLVSHRWNNLLRSPEVCRSLIHHFFPNNIEKHLEPVALFENLASRRLAFMNHKPSIIDEFVVHDPGEWNDRFSVDIDFESSRMAAWARGENSIIVRDLLCSKSPFVFPRTYMDNHGPIGEVSLSKSIVVAVSTTMGICQVWDLATRATHSFKLPGAIVATMHSDGYVTGILLHRQNLEYQLIVHNAATKKTKCIDIVCQEQYNGNQVIVHEASNRVIHVRFFVDGNMEIELTSWSIDTGKFLEKSTERALNEREVRKFWSVGNGRWAINTNLGHDSNSLHISHRQLDLTQPNLNITFKPYNVSINIPTRENMGLQNYTVGGLGTCGSITWTITKSGLDSDGDGRFSSEGTIGLIWEEGNLQARTIDCSPLRNARSTIPQTQGFSPYYFDPYDRFTLWGSCLSDYEDLEGDFLDGRGFESSIFVVERYYGIHERSEPVTDVAI